MINKRLEEIDNTVMELRREKCQLVNDNKKLLQQARATFVKAYSDICKELELPKLCDAPWGFNYCPIEFYAYEGVSDIFDVDCLFFESYHDQAQDYERTFVPLITIQSILNGEDAYNATLQALRPYFLDVKGELDKSKIREEAAKCKKELELLQELQEKYADETKLQGRRKCDVQ